MPRYDSGVARSPDASCGNDEARERLALTREHEHVSDRLGPGHQALHAVEPPTVLDPARSRARSVRIGVEARLLQRERSERARARDRRGQKLRALLVAAEIGHGIREQSRCQDREREREIAEGQLFGNQRSGERASRVATAEGLGESIRDESELVRAREHLGGDLSRLVGFARTRPDLAARELRHGVADQDLFLGRLEIDHTREYGRLGR